jgi:hypothetical protein
MWDQHNYKEMSSWGRTWRNLPPRSPKTAPRDVTLWRLGKTGFSPNNYAVRVFCLSLSVLVKCRPLLASVPQRLCLLAYAYGLCLRTEYVGGVLCAFGLGAAAMLMPLPVARCGPLLASVPRLRLCLCIWPMPMVIGEMWCASGLGCPATIVPMPMPMAYAYAHW